MEGSSEYHDLLKGTILEGVNVDAMLEMSYDCTGEDNRLFSVQPVYVDAKGFARLGCGVAVKGCCAGSVTRDAYTEWLPLLSGVNGFLTREIELKKNES